MHLGCDSIQNTAKDNKDIDGKIETTCVKRNCMQYIVEIIRTYVYVKHVIENNTRTSIHSYTDTDTYAHQFTRTHTHTHTYTHTSSIKNTQIDIIN